MAKRTTWAIAPFLAALLCLAPQWVDAQKAGGAESVGALGTLQTRDGLIELSGPGGTTIADVLVQLDQKVEAGQELVIFANRADLQANLENLTLEREELLANHARDDEVQRLRIEKARDDLKRAEQDLANYMALSKNAQASTVLEERRSGVAQAKSALRIAQAELARLRTRAGNAKDRLDARIQQAEAAIDGSILVAPSGGTVLRLMRRKGEAASGPILALADLSHMRVQCEVYEGDLGRVAVGQKAEVSSRSLPKKLIGKVALIGREVDSQRRVAKVWVDLDSPDPAARFLGMEVNVAIYP